jgi:hypothetical protein
MQAVAAQAGRPQEQAVGHVLAMAALAAALAHQVAVAAIVYLQTILHQVVAAAVQAIILLVILL